LVNALAERTQSLLADDDFEVTTNGATITITGRGRLAGRSNVLMPVYVIRSPLPLDERLELLLKAHGERLQAFLSRAHCRAWPAEGAVMHVRVTPAAMDLWWSMPGADKPLVEMQQIDRRSFGL
jgi:hypothetical protein